MWTKLEKDTSLEGYHPWATGWERKAIVDWFANERLRHKREVPGFGGNNGPCTRMTRCFRVVDLLAPIMVIVIYRRCSRSVIFFSFNAKYCHGTHPQIHQLKSTLQLPSVVELYYTVPTIICRSGLPRQLRTVRPNVDDIPSSCALNACPQQNDSRSDARHLPMGAFTVSIQRRRSILCRPANHKLQFRQQPAGARDLSCPRSLLLLQTLTLRHSLA